MKKIGTFEAKTHFSEILRQVAAGEKFCVTNRGKAVAIITPPESVRKQKTAQAFERLIELGKKHPIGSLEEVMTWKNEGRK